MFSRTYREIVDVLSTVVSTFSFSRSWNVLFAVRRSYSDCDIYGEGDIKLINDVSVCSSINT